MVQDKVHIQLKKLAIDVPLERILVVQICSRGWCHSISIGNESYLGWVQPGLERRSDHLTELERSWTYDLQEADTQEDLEYEYHSCCAISSRFGACRQQDRSTDEAQGETSSRYHEQRATTESINGLYVVRHVREQCNISQSVNSPKAE